MASTLPFINDKRETRGWMLYDFANSAFSTTVVTTFLGPYLTRLIESQVGDKGSFTLVGIPIAAESFFTYCVSLSVLLLLESSNTSAGCNLSISCRTSFAASSVAANVPVVMSA